MAIQEGVPDKNSGNVIHRGIFKKWDSDLKDLTEQEQAEYLARLPEGSNIGAGGGKMLEVRAAMGKDSYARLGDQAIRDLMRQEAA